MSQEFPESQPENQNTEAFRHDDKPELEPRWDKTEHVLARLKGTPFFEEASPGKSEFAEFHGRHIIGRDTPIQGGVYLGAGAREAIVVDEKYQGLDEVYLDLQGRLRRLAPRTMTEDQIAEQVWLIVMQYLPYKEEVVSAIARDYVKKQDHRISLDTYIMRGGGICRHQALLTGWLLEKKIRSGELGGRVSIDRNFVPGFGGHAWTRYANSENRVLIIDPANQYIGALNDMDQGVRFFYQRPEDK